VDVPLGRDSVGAGEQICRETGTGGSADTVQGAAEEDDGVAEGKGILRQKRQHRRS